MYGMQGDGLYAIAYPEVHSQRSGSVIRLLSSGWGGKDESEEASE